MKKFLLGLALIAPAFAASAQEVTEFFQVTYEGKILNDGDVIYATPDYDYEYTEEGKVSYFPHIKMINLEKDPRQVEGAFLFDNPTAAYYAEHAYADADYPYGFPSCCFSGGLAPDLTTPTSNCLPGREGIDAGYGQVIVPGEGNNTFQWEIHLEDADPNTVTEMSLRLYAQEGYANYGETITDPFTVKIIFSTTDSGVENVAIDLNAPAEYYDLQGRKVLNPAAGLYIVKQGDKVSKTIIR
ncbi:MAG: hypothetical protein K2M88_07230 [Muribaculaceae bacterium]|nr:hypothetical protein [Muribaculaceae bacterium]